MGGEHLERVRGAFRVGDKRDPLHRVGAQGGKLVAKLARVRRGARPAAQGNVPDSVAEHFEPRIGGREGLHRFFDALPENSWQKDDGSRSLSRGNIADRTRRRLVAQPVERSLAGPALRVRFPFLEDPAKGRTEIRSSVAKVAVAYWVLRYRRRVCPKRSSR